MKPIGIHILAVVVAMVVVSPHMLNAQTPAGTAFTYQGQLKDAGQPVTDTCTLGFELYDAASGGSQIGSTVTTNGVDVVNGLFTVSVDFGEDRFTGDARWLEIEVHCESGAAGFTTLSPRQELTPAPYAQHAAGPWVTGASGAITYHAGNVGIGVSFPPSDRFEVEESGSGITAGRFEHTAYNDDTPALAAYHMITPGRGIGLVAQGGSTGVSGAVVSSGSGSYYALDGLASGGSGNNYGVRGWAIGNGTNYGVYGKAEGSGNNYGGYFDGKVHVTDQATVDGDVGLGTTSPQGRLDLNTGTSETDSLYVRTSPSSSRGGVLHHQSSTYAWQETVTSTASPVLGTFRFHYVERTAPTTQATSDVLVLRADGHVGIGLLDPAQELDVNGEVRIRTLPVGSGTTVLASSSGDLRKLSSSRRYKTDITPLPEGSKEVLSLQPVHFRWKESGEHDIGLIAEDVERHVKELIVYDAEGKPDAVKYDRVAVYLLEIVKMQEERIAALETALKQLQDGADKEDALARVPGSQVLP